MSTFGYGQPVEKWIAYDNGSYEPVDPNGDLRKKPRGQGRPDWWVEDKEPGWQPKSFAPTKRGQQARQKAGDASNQPGVLQKLPAKPMPMTTFVEHEAVNPMDWLRPGRQYSGAGKSVENKVEPLYLGLGQHAKTHKEADMMQTQHRNTGHAMARLGGKNNGEVVPLDWRAENPRKAISEQFAPASYAQPNFARDARNLAQAEKRRTQPDFARDTRDLQAAEGAQPKADAPYRPPRMLEAGETFGDPNVDTSILNLFKELPNKDNYREPSWLEGTILDASAQKAAEEIAKNFFSSTVARGFGLFNKGLGPAGFLFSPQTAHAPTLQDTEVFQDEKN
ncbi:MAG: hypothetical protein AB7D51_00340 [Desulfovibrionaceae bacterium]